MMTYLVAFALAAVVSAILTPFVCQLAHVINAVDAPGEARKIHDRPIPRIGGIAVVLGFLTPVLGLSFYENQISRLMYADSRLVAAMALGCLAIVALGVYDDIKSAGAKLKLVVETIVAVGIWWAGYKIEILSNPLGLPIHLSAAASLALTVFWIVGITNAINLIDGLDGLAAGISLSATLVLFGVSFVNGNVLLCLLAAALAGSLLGFLFFNFNPARIFLGDSGALFLGFTLATISVWTQQKGATLAALVIPILALGLPILDTTLSVVRRVRRGKNPFQADREHLHHRLLALGLSHKNAVLTLYTASGSFALAGLALLDNDATRQAIALSAVCVMIYILVRKVSSAPSHDAVPRPLAPSETRDLVRLAGRRIRASRDVDEAWTVLTELATQLGMQEVRFALSSEPDKETVRHWRLRNDGSWRLDGALGPYDDARRLPISEGSETFGDLRVLISRGGQHDWRNRAELDHVLELLRDALIDFFVERAAVEALKDSGNVVAIEDKRARTAGQSR